MRREKGLSQNKLAEKLGVASIMVSRWERGIHIPNVEHAYMICELFGCTSDFLIGLKDA